jgi:hypothetical protein
MRTIRRTNLRSNKLWQRRVTLYRTLITSSIRSSSFRFVSPRCPKLKIDPESIVPAPLLPMNISPGIYPYLGVRITADELQTVAAAYGGAVVPGKQGAKLAAKVHGTLVDPAQYQARTKIGPDTLFGFDEWLIRQQTAGVPVVLTDTPRIRNRDRLALKKALTRWELLDEPTLVVLPIEPWWLKEGLPCLTEEVRAAGRPVAIVLMHRYNGLDAAGAVEGLLTFISAIGHLPVVLLRCDISAVGALTYGAFAGFVGWSASTRHGPLPMAPPVRSYDDEADERDESPGVFVPALHDYFKASRLPAFARCRRPDVLDCDDPVCRGSSLLQISRLTETDPPTARNIAYRHNLATTEQITRRIFSTAEPRDAWWEACKAGAHMSASLAGYGITLPAPRWLRQWIAVGSPSHDPEAVA